TAVLAEVPALIGRSPPGGGGGDLLLGNAAGSVFRRVKQGDALTEDLGLEMAKELLGPGIPTDDPALGIDGEDGDILHALHHEPEVFLGLAKGLLHSLAPGNLVLELAAALRILLGEDPRLGQLALDADLTQHTRHDGLEVVEEVRGLGYEVADPCPQRLDQQVFLLHARHEDGWHVMAGGLDLPEEFQAADARGELLIQDDQLDPALSNLPEPHL